MFPKRMGRIVVTGIVFCFLFTLLIVSYLRHHGIGQPQPGVAGDPECMDAAYKVSTLQNSSFTGTSPSVPKDLHPVNFTLINITNFQFIINRDICDNSSIGLVTLVHTAVAHNEARDIIRTTWGNPEIEGVNTRLVFLLGMPTDMRNQDDILSESYEHKDIVQGGFQDTYRNLSYKNIMGKYWVVTYCPQAEIVVKCDDDTYIDLYLAYYKSRELMNTPEYRNNSLLYGEVHYDETIKRDPDHKWYTDYNEITADEAPGDQAPPYIYGGFYMLNIGTARRLIERSNKMKFLWIDDLWIVGYIAHSLKITHMNAPGLFNYKNSMLLAKMIQSPELFNQDYMFTDCHRKYWCNKLIDRQARVNYKLKTLNNYYKKKAVLDEDDLRVEQIVQTWNVL